MRLIGPTLILACALQPASTLADTIEAGLWQIVSRAESGGVAVPPQQSSKCLTAEQARDPETTFSPNPRMVNSECGAIERTFAGARLTWRLVCKGQLNMELTGDYTFHEPGHYTATVRTRASMAGMPQVDSLTTLDARRVSDCP